MYSGGIIMYRRTACQFAISVIIDIAEISTTPYLHKQRQHQEHREHQQHQGRQEHQEQEHQQDHEQEQEQEQHVPALQIAQV